MSGSPRPDASADALIIERACPKVNLTLRVLGRRPDGYHELDSLVAFAADAADIITLNPQTSTRVVTSGPFGASIAGENLIAVTLNRIAEQGPRLRLGTLHLQKNVPIAAGIGGGSADAAAVIRAVIRANNSTYSSVDWRALAASLGADVPVCLASVAQHMTGLGEQVSRVPDLPQLACVLVNPMRPVPADKTAQVFRRLNAQPSPTLPRPGLPRFDDRASLLCYIRQSGNDLLAPARQIVPQIDGVLAALKAQLGCDLVQLSGGGPTCFGLFADWPSAQRAAQQIATTYPTWWVCPSRLS
jgi:4-diphosphocytidyl-2-C-methyl-D-erythritol kinase